MARQRPRYAILVFLAVVFFSISFFCRVASAIAQGDVTVKIDERPVLHALPDLYLGAISEITGDAVSGAAVARIKIDMKGKSVVTKDVIIDSIKSSGLKGVTFSLIIPDRIETLCEDPLSAAIRRQTGWPWKLKVTARDDSEGELIEFSRIKPGMNKVTAKVRLEDGSVRYKRFDVSWVAPLFTARSRIDFDSTLELSHIAIQTSKYEGGDIPQYADAILGKKLKTNLEAGSPIYLHDVEPLYLVKRGDRVRLYVNSGMISVETVAKALDSGALGDIIRVINLDSRRTISAKVAGKGAVVAKEVNP
ncbi:flagellar basal body P-ring formation chaperone FlgA [Acetomicrobium hydrogeniformans]|jgi:flagella basal body P-ring formation protein FlgA|uniref:Flagella basal body P-ring formation protein FlgA n=1 Tax=Acetomicrobium hydrogeniformans ATCC BAA-1850 TaxID=592015 RepID=A0A0T5XBW7_9BACT|nr:flagellar basal body P-ring formation chaperone FlgA [Acetomicrobium hydrogeniformans]KRT35849.1 flagella basal body P-ring formation protein FlgA [Acetomicrobium hydrogeniformans ATCC BAA-1850]